MSYPLGTYIWHQRSSWCPSASAVSITPYYRKSKTMCDISTAHVAAGIAIAVALSATPASAAENDGSSAGSSYSSTTATTTDNDLSSNFSGSSALGSLLDASDSQKTVWGIKKDWGNDDTLAFDKLTYVYVISSLTALVGGAAAFASQVPEVREIAEQFNIDLPRFF